MAVLFAAEINANINRGSAIPIPNTKKLNKFNMKLIVDVLIANNTIKDDGLQGKTIAPKKKPKINEVKYAFFVTGACILGNIFPTSILKTKSRLINANIPNAIGEIICIAFVNDF